MGGGVKEAHKHLCSSVGGYEINPPPNGGHIYEHWLGGKLEEKKKKETIFSQTLQQLRYAGSPPERSRLIARRKSLSSGISTTDDASNQIAPSPLPRSAVLPPCDI